MSYHTLESLIGKSLPDVIDDFIANRELEIREDGQVFLDDEPLDPSLIISMDGPYASKPSKAFDAAMKRALEVAEFEYEFVVDNLPLGSTVEMYRWRFFKSLDGEVSISRVFAS